VLILDTDAMTVWFDPRDTLHDRLVRRFTGPDAPRLATTVVSYQEQMSGWLARIHRARKPEEIVRAYANLLQTFHSYRAFDLLPYDHEAQARFEDFRRRKLRVPTMDLRIACIVLTGGATLLTRNLRDFRQVPGLSVEDWSRIVS
jgi:tRNA(fMet)-specific endonuclease VapC